MNRSCYQKITKTCALFLDFSSRNIVSLFEKQLRDKYEGACSISEGYVLPKSVQYVSHSSGNVEGAFVKYIVTFSCLAYVLVPGQLVCGKVFSITTAGIHFKSNAEIPSPFDGFIDTTEYSVRVSVVEGDVIIAKVDDVRVSLEDKPIQCICTLMKMRAKK